MKNRKCQNREVYKHRGNLFQCGAKSMAARQLTLPHYFNREHSFKLKEMLLNQNIWSYLNQIHA